MILRGAISGFGAVAAQAHLAGWQSQPHVSIVAVHDPAAARRHLAINLVKNIRVYDDLELMLDGEALDFVDIASPPPFHAPAAKQVLRAGANVIVEKPLCLTREELAELTQLAASTNRLLLCVHNWKYSPAYRRAQELITAGRLGQIQYISLVRMRTAPAGTPPAGTAPANYDGAEWRRHSKSGGGILIDHGWHSFYLAHWLTGGQKPVSVSSYLGFDAHTGVDTLAHLRIRFPGTTIVNVLLTWDSPVRKTAAFIVGTDGVLEMDADKILFTEGSGRTASYSLNGGPDDSYHRGWFAAAAADYTRALNEGPGTDFAGINLDEAATALALTIAARQSASLLGSAVAIDAAE
ncbi:MAG: Gfo/Idh/MocA family oxidoreductase [Deltaproteobacteria bacterium]|nr:Gfo/Idh/MocA family oxidoreductase [Deltaproteobacteria bacterium]